MELYKKVIGQAFIPKTLSDEIKKDRIISSLNKYSSS